MGTVIRHQSAAIPYRREAAANHVEVLLVTSRRRARWVLPKGNIKYGLLPHASAAEEAYEEAGVVGCINPVAVGTYQQTKLLHNVEIELAVQAFPLLVSTELQAWPEMAIRTRRWMSLPEAINSVEDEALRAILTSFENVIRDPNWTG